MAILSVSICKYFKTKGKAEGETITLGLPASFKKIAESAETLDLSN